MDPFGSEGIVEEKSLLTLMGNEVILLCHPEFTLVISSVRPCRNEWSSTISLFGLIIRIPKKIRLT